jgi:hypothetical protein
MVSTTNEEVVSEMPVSATEVQVTTGEAMPIIRYLIALATTLKPEARLTVLPFFKATRSSRRLRRPFNPAKRIYS